MPIIYTSSRANTNTRVGQLFSLSWKLAQHHKDMITMAKNKTKSFRDFKYFENFLNDLYTSKNSSYIDEKKIIDEEFNNFISNLVDNTIVTSNGEIKLNKKVGNNSHSKFITMPVLRHKIKEIENLLDEPTSKVLQEKYKNGTLNIDLNKIKKELSNFIDSDELLSFSIKDSKRYLSTAQGSLRYTDETKKLIDDVDNLYRAIRYVNGEHLGPAYGAGWERSLASFDKIINKKAEDETEKIIKETFSKETIGDKITDRGSLYSEIYNNINQSYITKGDNSDLIRINSFDPKQGKMDVLFRLPNESNTATDIFRISAKSWAGISGQDFGETSLFSSLMRSANFDYTFAYGLTVGYYNPKGNLWETVEAHEFAKTCILLDVLMGYSQKKGYADTIVIQDRTNNSRPIKVISIHELLTKIQGKIKNIKSISYKYNTLNIRGDNHTQWWLTKLQSQMHQIKVTVTSGILNEI